MQLPPALQLTMDVPQGLCQRRIRRRLGQTGEAVTALVRREDFLPASALEDNRRRIWNLLQQAAAAGAPMTTPPDAR